MITSFALLRSLPFRHILFSSAHFCFQSGAPTITYLLEDILASDAGLEQGKGMVIDDDQYDRYRR